MKISKIQLLLIIIIILFATIVSAQTITVVTEEYPPYNYTEGGKITGASTEIVEAILKIAGMSYTLKSYPWARTYKMAQDKKNVLIYSIGRSKKREKMFKWVDIIAPYDIYLFKLKSRSDVTVSSLDDARKYEIGGVRDDVRTQHLQELGFKLQIVETDLLNLRKLNVQRIDLFPIDILACVYLVKKNGFDPENYEKTIQLEELSSGLYMAFSKQTDDTVVEKLKKALDKHKSGGEFNKILNKYMK